MKKILLFFLLIGCSATRYYDSSALSEELRKNELGLMLITDTIETDFQYNQKLLRELGIEAKNPFIMKNLIEKMKDIERKKQTFLEATSHLRTENQDLIKKVSNRTKIREDDPVFKAIEDFAEDKNEEQFLLLKKLENYQKASEEFKQLTFDSRMV